MLKPKIYNYRFEIFLLSQLGILFGSLIFPFIIFDTIVLPLLFLVNISAGIILMRNRPKLKKIVVAMVITSVIIIGIQILLPNLDLSVMRISINFLVYIMISYQLISQVWKARIVNRNVIAGLISGYISLGFIGFFICMSIEILSPNSFSGINPDVSLVEEMMYYSYITLLTIGYGDILPVTPIAQKASIFIGLMGQMYLVVVTAIVVGKYINQISIQKEE